MTGRAMNWGAEEKEFLVDVCCNMQLSEMTSAFWDSTTEQINAIGNGNRTKAQVKKKWADTKSKVKKEAVQIAIHNKGTGGGPPVKNLSVMEEKVMNSLPICVTEGVKGGTDTFTDSMPLEGGFVTDVESGKEYIEVTSKAKALAKNKSVASTGKCNCMEELLKIENEKLEVMREYLNVHREMLDLKRLKYSTCSILDSF